MKHTFIKDERLICKKSINNIYKNGQYLQGEFFFLKWLKSTNQNTMIRLLISVPKKNVKKAVDRNYIKRVIRESYKLNKALIYESILQPIDVLLIYHKTTMPDFKKIKIELLSLFQKVAEQKNEIN